MLATRRLVALGGVGSRAFKQVAGKAKAQAAQDAAAAAQGGRDPYGLFKTAIASTTDASAAADAHVPPSEWHAQRKAYSRAKMLERHRVDKHFTHMIKLRDAAVAALPDELQREARSPDYTAVPIERRVFTETAPIPDFQLKLQQRK